MSSSMKLQQLEWRRAKVLELMSKGETNQSMIGLTGFRKMSLFLNPLSVVAPTLSKSTLLMIFGILLTND
jgi:hypothetical protein